jgi:hypothetical protein
MQPPLKKIEDEYMQLMSDKTKFIAFIQLHEQKADKMRALNVRARAAIQDHGRCCETSQVLQMLKIFRATDRKHAHRVSQYRKSSSGAEPVS